MEKEPKPKRRGVREPKRQIPELLSGRVGKGPHSEERALARDNAKWQERSERPGYVQEIQKLLAERSVASLPFVWKNRLYETSAEADPESFFVRVHCIEPKDGTKDTNLHPRFVLEMIRARIDESR